MELYEILHQIGEGSFGQVFKAKKRITQETVAYKVVRKAGRTNEELKSLRKECKILRCLSHPNIIRLLDSFETENEIVVVSEYADKVLHELLAESGRLSEERAQVIACDLVSALYYLHSNKVLHRDLKPQNILLDANGIAKLCDFGFASSINKDTDVLTSIKGTPLYMAPELIEEYSYDHNIDLWSLGCVTYELVTGFPPFPTTSIVQLINFIRHEPIKWPNFITLNCKIFLQGLLQKDPAQRLTWPSLLTHPFVKNRILIIEENIPVLMRSLSSTCQHCANNISHSNCLALQDNLNSKPNYTGAITDNISNVKSSSHNLSKNAVYVNQIDICDIRNDLKSQYNNEALYANFPMEDKEEGNIYENTRLFELESSIDDQPIENEEWIAFLKHSIKEIMEGEIESLLQENCVTIFISPLKNAAASSRVIEYIANLLSLPFVVSLSKDDIENIQKIYIQTAVVSNLICAMQNLMINTESKQVNVTRLSKKSESASVSTNKLQALEAVILLLCRLIHIEDEFVRQFCDTVDTEDKIQIFYSIFHLEKRKTRIIADLIAIFIKIMQIGGENVKIIEKILLEYQTKELIDLFTKLMRHQLNVLRSRTCILIYLLGKCSYNTLQRIWGRSIRNSIEALIHDNDASVKKTAEGVIIQLRQLAYFDQEVEAS